MPLPRPTSPRSRLLLSGTALAAVAILASGCQSSDTAEPAPPSDSNTAQPTPDETTEELKDCAAPTDPPEAGEVFVSAASGVSTKGEVRTQISLRNTSDFNAYNIHIDLTIELYGEDVTYRLNDQLDPNSPMLSMISHGSYAALSPVLDQPEDWPSEVIAPPDLVVTAEIAEVEQWCAPVANDDPFTL